MEKIKLNDVIQINQTGEWGTELKANEIGTRVIRTADFNNDGTINYDNVVLRNIPQKKIDEKKLHTGDIIVEKSGGTDKNPVGRVVYFEKNDLEYLANNFTQVIRMNEKMNPKFVFYNLFYNYKIGTTLQMFNKTTGIQNLQMKQFLNQKISYTTLDEQDKIVKKLDGIKNIIELKQNQIKSLEELIKSQFVEMFGDPIKNEKRWKTEQMNKVSPVQNYKGKLDGKVWLLNLDMVESQTGKILSYVYEDAENIGASTCAFSEENVLYSKLRPYLNKVVLPDRKGFATSELVPLLPNKEKINRTFLCHLLRSEYFVGYISEKVAGAKMPRVSMDLFRKFEVIEPPIELQNQFADFVDHIDKLEFVKIMKRDSATRLEYVEKFV